MTYHAWWIASKITAMEEDSIEIKNLQAVARVGITDIERLEMQQVSICLHLVPDGSLSGLADDINRTVNYHTVSQRVREVAAGGECRLIETLAEDIAVMLLAEFDLREVAVEVRKFVLPETDYVAVKLLRQR